jgi:hypothetical protein
MNGVHYVELTRNGNVRRFCSMGRLGADVRSICFIPCVTWETTEFALSGTTVYLSRAERSRWRDRVMSVGADDE